MKINLAMALCKNLNCFGYIIMFNNGKCTYQNDNDLGLDFDAINVLVECKKVFIYKRYYAYVIEDNIDDDGTGIDFDMAILLLKECHKHIVPLTEEENKKCEEYWKKYF